MSKNDFNVTFLGLVIGAILLLSWGISYGGSFIVYDMYDGFVVVGTIALIMVILMIIYWTWQRWQDR